MAVGWRDNLRRLLGWWSSVPPVPPSPTEWIETGEIVIKAPIAQAALRRGASAARVKLPESVAGLRSPATAALIRTPESIAFMRPR